MAERDDVTLAEATVDQLFKELQSRFSSLLLVGTRIIQEGDTEHRFYMQFTGCKTLNYGCASRARDIMKRLCMDDCSERDDGVNLSDTPDDDEDDQ